MLISGHLDARIFRRYNIVDTRDIADATRELSECEAGKREDRVLRSRMFTNTENDNGKNGISVNVPLTVN